MVALSTNDLLDKLRKSKLVENDRLDEAVARIQREAGTVGGDDGPALAEKLVAAKIITSWQRDQLIEGHYKGFFLGDGKYKLLGLLGTGGMSRVYLAEHSKMQRLVAIKHLPPNRVKDSSYLARFYREAQAAARLDHKNIVRAYDIDHEKEKDYHFLVMEYVEGRDLQTLVKDVGPIDYDTAAEYIRQAAEGLEHAHQAGLVHRDIKPANLLVDPRGVVKVLDMGLARWAEDDKQASLTIAHEENVLGTADYLAPEQARDSHTVDKRADIYSLGCTLYFLLTGHPPFPEGTLAQRIWKHQNQSPKSIYEERKDAPTALVDLCNRMMSKQPEARFQTAGEVSTMLGKWLESRGREGLSGSGIGTARRTVGPPPRRSASRSGGVPILPPRRTEKPGDDTVSNMDHETAIRGAGGPSSPSPSTIDKSNVKYGSGILNQPGSNAAERSSPSRAHRGGSSILGFGDSNVLGKPGASGKNLDKGSSKSLPVAKPLDIRKTPDATKSGPMPQAPGKAAGAHDDTLSKLIDQAVEQAKAASPKTAQQTAATQPMRQLTSDAPVPAWMWFALGGGLLLVVGTIVAVLMLVRL